MGVIIGSLVLVALAELCRPRRRREFPALRRRLGNLGIWLLNLVLAAFTFAPPDIFRVQLADVFGVRLLTWPIADALTGFVAGFLLLDFLQYAMHRCQHAVPFLWRLHALHHSDPDVDVTTSVRHHPVEYLPAYCGSINRPAVAPPTLLRETTGRSGGNGFIPLSRRGPK